MEQMQERVKKIFMDCLFRNEEVTDAAIVAEGILQRYGFHPERLKGHREGVRELIGNLPASFLKEEGGGWSGSPEYGTEYDKEIVKLEDLQVERIMLEPTIEEIQERVARKRAARLEAILSEKKEVRDERSVV